MLLFHTESSTKYGKPGLYWVNHFTTICEEHFFQECSLFFFEKQEGVSLSQAAAAKITVSPTTVFSGMTSPNTGQSYATTITVSNCPTKPTVSITMNEQLDNGSRHQMGDAGNSEPVSAGNNTWTFKVWPANWYHATGGTGISLVPGWYCQGKVTVTLTIGNSATVSIQGNVPTN